MSRAAKTVPIVVLCAFIIAAPPAWAYWIPDGVRVSTAATDQMYPQITSDGVGGAIVTWYDYRSGSGYGIYAQRMSSLGTTSWTTDGVALCTTVGNQMYPTIASDGVGGAVVTWQRSGSGIYSIYAQRINASGLTQWDADGVVLCTGTGECDYPTIASDGAGGAIVTWYDGRGGSNFDIYAQRVNASGTALWTANGIAICTATGTQQFPQITSDGAGGAIITWDDYRAGYGIYAQRVNASGVVQWTANGIAICTATGNQMECQIASDGAGGAIITWDDYRAGYGIYAQRVNASGVAQWTANGVSLCTASGSRSKPMILPDGAGGAFVTWYDYRNGTADIYAQRVNSSGAAQWTANGVALCTAPAAQSTPTIASDGAGGAIVTWFDYRNDVHPDIYAQRVNGSGVAQWTTDGVPVCTGAGTQQYPLIISDTAGGAIITWWDQRGATQDVFAQRIDSKGQVRIVAPVIHYVRDVPHDQGGYVNIAIDRSRLDDALESHYPISQYNVWRRIVVAADARTNVSSGTWELLGSFAASHRDQYICSARTLADSTASGNPYSVYAVSAQTTTPSVWFMSAPDSGYSVDNIAPAMPGGLAATQSYVPIGLHLAWNMNQETDLAQYAVYRGTSSSFVPAPGNRVATPVQPEHFDNAWRWYSGYYYKVSAIDIHGNESVFAPAGPDDVTGTDTPKAPASSYLAQNYPNPFNPTTRIAFGLSAPGSVLLRIYDASGRLVRVLVNDERRAGRYEETWDGRDSSGRAVASGIYFYRFVTGSFKETRKMALMR